LRGGGPTCNPIPETRSPIKATTNAMRNLEKKIINKNNKLNSRKEN
jgi:hypothetical protein